MVPQYDLEKIKSGVEGKVWDKAVALYEGNKITEFEESHFGFSALVLGTESYDVAISENHYHQGDCSCFMGRQGILCKHMVALAIYAIFRGKSLGEKTVE